MFLLECNNMYIVEGLFHYKFIVIARNGKLLFKSNNPYSTEILQQHCKNISLQDCNNLQKYCEILLQYFSNIAAP